MALPVKRLIHCRLLIGDGQRSHGERTLSRLNGHEIVLEEFNRIVADRTRAVQERNALQFVHLVPVDVPVKNVSNAEGAEGTEQSSPPLHSHRTCLNASPQAVRRHVVGEIIEMVMNDDDRYRSVERCTRAKTLECFNLFTAETSVRSQKIIANRPGGDGIETYERERTDFFHERIVDAGNHIMYSFKGLGKRLFEKRKMSSIVHATDVTREAQDICRPMRSAKNVMISGDKGQSTAVEESCTIEHFARKKVIIRVGC